MLRKLFIIKAIIIMAIVAFAGSGLALAQGKTNLSGSYTFDEAKSDPAPAGRGGGGGGRGGGGVASAITIKQTPTEITIESTTGRGPQSAVYKVGAESTISMGRGEMKAKTTWEGDKLVIDGTQGMGDTTIQRKDVYSLAGTVLTIERTTTSPQGTQTRKLIYNKAP